MSSTRARGVAVVGTVVLAGLVPAGAAQASPVPTGDDLAAKAGCSKAARFSQEGFSDPTRIDNRFLPMEPGTRLTYDGVVEDQGGTVSHRVVFTVTDMTKVVKGVPTRVVYDVDVEDGEVIEEELAFFVQSDAGNVWNVGEYPEEYEGGEFAGAPDVWIAGLDGASGGVHMLASPEDRANRHVEYLQGSAPSIDFLDCAQVADTGGRVEVPAGRYCDVLTTHERSPLEPGNAVQVKEHAPGVGIVRISAIDDPEAETLVLTEVAHLGPEELGAVDEAVAAQDVRGHQVSDVYGRTPPVVPPGDPGSRS